MDIKYHINIVSNPASGYTKTSNDIELIAQAKSLYTDVESAMNKVIEDGNYKAYIKAITFYDQFIWTNKHKPNQSNMFANPKIKVSPTWTEQLWAVVFERVRRNISSVWGHDLVLIQNKSSVECVGPNGPTAFKDVDCGIGIIKQFKTGSAIMPIVASECKTGHFCKTACTGVDSIVRRVRSMNDKVLALCITDNNISVGKDVEVDHSFGSGGVLIQQRGIGNNKAKSNTYPKLEASQFEFVENLCIDYLLTKTATDFLNVKVSNTSGVYLREHIEDHGYYVPPHLEEFIKAKDGERLSVIF